MTPNLYVISGAGLSAESGVPTFRTAGGIWAKYDMQRVCNALTWKDHRSEVFEFYRHCREGVDKVAPNGAHKALARLQNTFGSDRVQLLTQNVDDLLERAGAQEVIHLHGDLKRLQCTACGHFWEVGFEQFAETTRCPACESLRGVKPAVVFFQERAPNYVHLNRMAKRLEQQDILLAIGTSMQVISPASLMPVWRKGHARNFQVNLELAEKDWFGENIATGATNGMEQLEGLLSDMMDRLA